MRLEQLAEMLTNMFADPTDTTEAVAALGPPAMRCHFLKPFMGAMSLQFAKPTTQPADMGGKGEEKSTGQHHFLLPSSSESPAIAFPQP